MIMGLAQQIQMTRIYRELARRACLQNRTHYAIQYRAALEVAWALLDIEYPTPVDVQTDSQGLVIDPRVFARRQRAAELREIERAPAASSW